MVGKASIIHHCCEAGTIVDFIQIQEAGSSFGALAETFLYHIPYRFLCIVPILEACNYVYFKPYSFLTKEMTMLRITIWS